jgi:TPR repeat protein
MGNERFTPEELRNGIDALLEKGDARAQFVRGTYILTQGEECGYDEARKLSEGRAWLEKSALQGYVDAQYNLGNSFDTGSEADPHERAEGLKWTRLAAMQGHREAQYNLAWALLGTPENEEGCGWLLSAANQGCEKSAQILEDPDVQYNIGCYASRNGRLDTAEEYLLKAIEGNPKLLQEAEKDADYANLRNSGCAIFTT